MKQEVHTEDCCQDFDPKRWDEVTHVWQDKLFIKDSLPQFFHLPLPGVYKKVFNRLWKQAKNAQADPPAAEFLLLAHDPSPWKSDLYMAVNNEVSGAENVSLSGTFISKVFDGPFSKIPQFIRDMDLYLIHQHKLALRYYIFCATCPECRKKHGHNYIVAFAEI